MTEQTPTIPRPSRLGAFIRRNPVALKELRGRMRGPRAFIVLTVYVALMSLFTVVLYLIYATSRTVMLSTTGGVIGKLIFGGIVAVELFLVCFIAPAFTAGQSAGSVSGGRLTCCAPRSCPRTVSCWASCSRRWPISCCS